MIKGEWVGLFAECSSSVANKLLAEISRLKINVKDIYSKDDGLYLTIKRQNINTLNSAVQAYNIDFKSYRLYGISATLNSVKLRAGLIIGVIIGIIAVIILSNYTLDIKINCDRDMYYGKVEQTLQKSGLIRGIPLSKVDNKQLEDAILNTLSESVFVTVHTNGVVVYVDVVTVPLTDEYVKDGQNISSSYEGIVTRVIVNSGTALVSAGDSVKVGAVLIDGYINTNKGDYQTPEQVVKVPVEASGEVYAKVFYHKRIYTAEQTVMTRRTGKQKTIRQLFLGKLPMGKASQSPYNISESITTTSMINVLVPINVITITYFEIESYTLDKDAYKECSIIMARAEIMDKLPQGAKIINEQTIVSNIDKSAIDYYIEVEQRIDDGGHNYSYTS